MLCDICSPDAQRTFSKQHSKQTHQSADNAVIDFVIALQIDLAYIIH